MNIMYKTEKYLNIIMAAVLAISLMTAGVSEGFFAAGNVRNECLRLHVLASSDSEADQKVKLLVRDALLESSAGLFEESTDSEDAVEKILENKAFLEETANEVLRENGFSYTAKISIEEEYFETRQYEDVKLPSGTYTACKVILGEGKGQNWWCVMFPPLCLPAAMEKNEEEVYAVFGENGGDLVTEKSGYKIKFKIVEIVEEIIEAIKNHNLSAR
ncbi:MAG: stage II sporulation protein R [Clostridia bacterium]|nr:stage II sporulation protein R [Clostridia bacterium]